MSVTKEEDGVEKVCEEYNAALDYAIDVAERADMSGILFLSMWREGDWDGLKRDFPDFSGPLPGSPRADASSDGDNCG